MENKSAFKIPKVDPLMPKVDPPTKNLRVRRKPVKGHIKKNKM